MIPEIEILRKYFEGKIWNPDTEIDWYTKIKDKALNWL